MTTFLFFLPFILLFVVVAIYAERKISAFIQDRIGPMEVGKYGLLQTIADLLKLLQKEDVIATSSDKIQFKIGPVIVFTAIFAGFAILPLSAGISGAGINTGIYFLMAIISMDVLGILMTGWGSNSKFSLFGAMRSVAQIISYEVPLGLSILCVVMLSQTLDLQEMSFQQGIYINDFTEGSTHKNNLFGFIGAVNLTEVGGILTWNIFRMPFLFFVFIIFFIASLAESNRAPFDLPEAESELIGGYLTEYSGFRFAILMLSEFAMVLLVSLLGVILFFGSWNSPFPNIGVVKLADWTMGIPGTLAGNIWGGFWLISKAILLVFIQMWIRWTFPRLRVDQLMSLSWKYLTPAALILVFIMGIWKVLVI